VARAPKGWNMLKVSSPLGFFSGLFLLYMIEFRKIGIGKIKRRYSMEKIVVEVGSTVTKVDGYDGKCVKHLADYVIEFKKNFKKENRLSEQDVEELIKMVKKLQEEYENVYVCGTSVFRALNDEQKREFLDKFKNNTDLDFDIISPEKENEFTVVGATQKVNQKVAVFVGGGGSTEIAVYDNGIKEMVNTPIGVIDIMNMFPDLADDFPKVSLDEVKRIVEEKLNVPNEQVDVLILAGGGHKRFALGSGFNYVENSLYEDENEPIMMDIETRINDTERYFKEISLDEIRGRVDDPDWWYATRAMTAFVLVVAEKMGVKYVVPTDVSMVYGLLK